MTRKMPQLETKQLCVEYRMPVLKKSKNDWRIEFYCLKKGVLKRHQIRVNRYRKRFPNVKQAELYIQTNICEPLQDMLKTGWTPDCGKLKIIKEQLTLNELLEDFYEAKLEKYAAKTIGYQTVKQYSIHIETIRHSMTEAQGKLIDGNRKISDITPQEAEMYILKLKSLRDLSITSANNMIKFLRMLYKHAQDSNFTTVNPFASVPLLKGEVKGKRTLSQQEQRKIANYLYDNNLPFYIFTQLVYADLIRPVEIFRLQKRDIDICNFVIKLPASKTKNKKPRKLLIPKTMQAVFAEYIKYIDFINLPANAYVFHRDFRPAVAEEPLSSAYSSMQWRQMRNSLGLPDDCMLYGLRHTGICDMLNVLPANTVRLHADHSDLKQTMHYADHETDELRQEVANKAPIYGDLHL